MNKLLLAGVFGLSLGVSTASAEGEKPKAGVDAKAAFAKLKTLAGDWKTADGKHHGAGDGKSPSNVFKVTAGGSVLTELQFPGTEHEMLSVYYMEGKDLVLTHYCMVQNQPKMKLNLEKSTADNLIFDFAGGTNFDPAKDMHIHAARINIKSKNEVVSEWDAYKDGKLMHGEVFNLTR